MNRKEIFFRQCLNACRSGETVTLDYPLSARWYLRDEVQQFNRKNPPHECKLERIGNELVIMPIIHVTTIARASDELRAIVGLQMGGDIDTVARGHYDRATANDVSIGYEKFNRVRLKKLVETWNEQKRGDVAYRKHFGRWVFYRKAWLKGRDFYKAMDVWFSVAGM
jgi:hypothetical protein